MSSIFLAFINTFALVVGQVLFKLGSAGKELSSLTDVIKLMFTPTILLALAVYGCTTLLWVYILNRSKISVVYPIQSLAIPIVMIISSFIFKEEVTLTKYIGAALVCVGVFVTTR
ncbi:MAG: EamA family transporter [Firmicutes bacterium]|nr:EamA family transporter [Bacillota bacterium]